MICAVRAAASVCPALKRLHECETVDRYRALPREPGLPQARSTSATLVAAVADGVGQRATRSSQMAARARHRSLLKHELADQDLPRGDTGVRPGQIAPRDVIPAEQFGGASRHRTSPRRGHNVHHAQLDSGNRLEGTQGG